MESCIGFLTQYLFFSLHFNFLLQNSSFSILTKSPINPLFELKCLIFSPPFHPSTRLSICRSILFWSLHAFLNILMMVPYCRQTKSTHSLEQYTNTLWIPGMYLWLLKTCSMSETVVNLITRETHTHTHIYTQGGGIMPGKWPYYCLKALNQAASKYSCTRQGIGQQLSTWHGDECRHTERAMDNILYVWVTTNSLYCINNMLLMHFELHV